MEKPKVPRIQWVAGVLALLALLSMVAVTYYYTWHRPQTAAPAEGRIFAVAVSYGRVVFVTSHEKALLLGTQVAWALAGVSAILSAYFTRPKPPREPGE